MIQCELSVLITLFYMLGQKKQDISGDNALLYQSLDQWQRSELSNAWAKGYNDSTAK
ncbi:hypothetical protein [Klebsiella phage phiKp_21]|uniref:Uncharacterized protein n=1 Tax=Klebsiella phage vB_KleM_RaK2 TaxID=1147094 RepID=H6X4F6_9CAUD|nr:hypothetical protein F403_gp186 [Klebsiella phage vB_KleM_RaK2]YP_010843347.1 hypothetical protein ACQ27_gp463 [Klebsiella phage K64-1]AFA44622.1 hypothetical protein RaK2_00349 [Klebsiella phage vB_KleM_RaK2]BEH88220.1 hypothetical protein [Klebsiella phage phiKp_21]